MRQTSACRMSCWRRSTNTLRSGNTKAVAFVLWAMHSHVFERFMITPRLALKSPMPGCGKTTLLDVLALLTPRCKRIDHTTAAALYRGIDRDHPTILIDEADNLEIVGTIRSVMDRGYRKGGVVSRCIDGEDRDFSTFAPMAVAVIGTLPESCLERSIIINMRRTLRTDLRQFDIDDPHIAEVMKPIRADGCWARTNPPLDQILICRRSCATASQTIGWCSSASPIASAMAGARRRATRRHLPAHEPKTKTSAS